MADLSPEIADAGEHDFLAGRAMAQRAAVDQAWQSLLGAPTAPAAAAATAPVVAGQPPAEAAPVAAPVPVNENQPLGRRLVVAPVRTAINQGVLNLGDTAMAVASDVGRGIVDAPRQIAGGALDFVNNISKFADVIAEHADAAGLPDVYVRLFDENGHWSPNIETAQSYHAAQAAGDRTVFQVPTTGSPDTITGQLTRAAVPLILGRGTSGSVVGSLSRSLPGELARDFISGVVSQNPASPRLSNIIDQVAPNAVTDFLKAKPGDEDTILGRIKSGLEYAGLGAAVGGAIRVVKALKGAMPASELEQAIAEPSAAPGAPEARPPAEAAPGAAVPPVAEAPPSAPAAAAAAPLIDDPLALQQRGELTAARAAQIAALPPEEAARQSAAGVPVDREIWPVIARNLENAEASREGGVGVVADQMRYLPDDGVPKNPSQREAVAVIGRAMDAEAARGGDLAAFRADADAAYRAKEGGTPPDLSAAEAARAAVPAAATVETPPRPPQGMGRDFLRLGDPLAPAVEIKPTAQGAAMAEVTAGRMAGAETPGATAGGFEGAEPTVMSPETISAYLAGARVDNPVKVNLARIGSNEDIGDALAQVSRTIPQQAVQSNEATIAAADALGLQPAQFLNGYKGQNLSASETTAMRFMLDSSASQLVDYAEAARGPLASAETKAQFLKAFTVHRSLQAYFENARAEAGRTLQAWSIMSQQRSGYSKAIGDLVRNAEGTDGDLGEMAERIATLDPLQAGRFVASSMQGSGRDLFLKSWYNSLLSSPTTVIKKLMSDVGMATWNVATTGLAEKFGDQIPEGETGQLLGGYTGSFKDAVRAGGRALMAGRSQFYRDYSTWEGGTGGGSVADQVTKRFNLSAAFNGAPEMISPAEPTRGALQYIRALMPTSWIAGADDFAKVWNYRAELRRLAWRAADGDADTFARLMDNPTAQLNQQAFGSALKTTFQEPLGPLGQSISDAVNAVSFQIPNTNFELPLGRLVVPFTKVPFNIAKMAAENSPLALLMREPQAILSGGPSPARDLMIARIGLGTGVSLGLADLALNNYLTGKGPTDPSLRREWVAAGNQPYSLQVPGLAPVRLNQIEPFGMTLGAIADTFNILKFSEDEKDFGTLVPSLALGIGNALLSKTYFEGISRMLDAIAHPEQQGDRWAEGMIAGFAPQMASRVARAMDDWERAHYGYIDSVEEKLPFLRNNLPPQRTLWGDPVPIREGFMPLISGTPAARILSPMQLGPSPGSVEPIDRWIWDNRSAFPLANSGDPRGILKTGQTQVFGQSPLTLSVKLDPQTYDRMQELAGNGLKDPRTGMGAKDYLNALVGGTFPGGAEQREWDMATPEAKALTVQQVVTKYRAAAKQQLLSESPTLRSVVEDGLKARAAALTGTPPR